MEGEVSSKWIQLHKGNDMEKLADLVILAMLLGNGKLNDEELLAVLLTFIEDEFGPDLLKRAMCKRTAMVDVGYGGYDCFRH
jgi:hypothetical protein